MALMKPVGGSTATSAICRLRSLSPIESATCCSAFACIAGSIVVVTVSPPLSMCGQLPATHPGRWVSSHWCT